MPRKPIVGGNWKCNPAEVSKVDGLVEIMAKCDTANCEVYFCPSNLHVGIVYGKSGCVLPNGAAVAPQNCNYKGCGAFTGEMSADQMVDMGIKWCLIGHSERRGEFGLPTPAESSALLATKCAYLYEKGIKCIYAIGEPLPIREQGIDAVLKHCADQLLPFKEAGLLDPAKIVIAYEPVWAIGTGVAASADQAQETHAALRKWLAENVSAEVAEAMRIQYGGSANAKNAPELSAKPDIDGFLVGSASLKPEFVEICAAIAEAKK